MTGTTSTTARGDAVAELLDVLAVEPDGPERFVGRNLSTNLPQVFGGQMLAQALVAASRTAPAAMTANSLHAYFLRAGEAGRPICFEVAAVRDGRRLATRAVTATQAGRTIATALVSFAATAGAVHHQPAPDAGPRPEAAPLLFDAPDAAGREDLPVWKGFDSLEIRGRARRVAAGADRPDPRDSHEDFWMRTTAPLPDRELVHQAIALFMSDVLLLSAALVPHGVPVGDDPRRHVLGDGRRYDGMSLDHAMWFHRPLRADGWLRFAQRSPYAGDGRAFGAAEVFDDAGRLVATAVQEGIIHETAVPPGHG